MKKKKNLKEIRLSEKPNTKIILIIDCLVIAGKNLKSEIELDKIRDKFSDEKRFQTVGLS